MSAIQDTAAGYTGATPGRPHPVIDYWRRLRADSASLRRVLMIGGIAVVAFLALAFWLTGGRYVGTDDSYVHAGQLMVSTDVSGLVTAVNVKEGQHVKAGQVLFKIDPLPVPDRARQCQGQSRPDAADDPVDARGLHAHAARHRRPAGTRCASTRSRPIVTRRW